MRILFLISSEGHFGAENMLLTLAKGLERQGLTSVIGVFNDVRFQHTEIADHAKDQGLPVELIPCKGRVDITAIRRVRDLIQQYHIDVVHSHGYKSDLYAYAANTGQQAALVATCHNWPNPRFMMRLYAVLDRLVLRAFQRVTVISTEVERLVLASGVKRHKVSLIANGVDLGRFGPPPSSQAAKIAGPVVTFVGRLVAEKGGEVLLRAAAQVQQQLPNAEFVFAGEGPARRDWEALADGLGIASKVKFLGVCHDMPSVYHRSDLVVLPSLCEAMPMCLLEAMAAHRPVIATRVGSIPDVVKDGDSGLLVPPGDTVQLASAILRVLRDRDFSKRLAERGFDRVRDEFSAEAMAAKYAQLYAGALSSISSPADQPSAVGATRKWS